MRLKFLTLSVATAVSIALSTVVGHAAILLDGSFETNAKISIPAVGFTTVGGGNSSTIADWTVTGGSVDWVGSYWQASDGIASIDLDGNTAGGIKQTMMGLTKNKEYAVTFDLSVNIDGGPPLKQVKVQTGSSYGIFSDLVTNETHPNMEYIPETLDFIATGKTELLSFASYKTPGEFGAVIDNVAVTAVPEASTWVMMLAGFGLLGFAGYRRGKSNDRVAA